MDANRFVVVRGAVALLAPFCCLCDIVCLGTRFRSHSQAVEQELLIYLSVIHGHSEVNALV